MANVTTTTNVPSGTGVYYDKLLLARAEPYQIHNKAAQTRSVPSKNSNLVKFRRYSNLARQTTPLTEGITPAGQSLDVTDITLQLKQYGDFITITDDVQYIVEDNVLNETTDLLGQEMGEVIDEITRDALAATASVHNAENGVNGGTPTEISYADVQTVVKTLMGQSARTFTPKISGSNKFGTSPIRNAYWAMAHTDIQDDIEDIDEFKHAADYGSDVGIMDSEWGSVGNTRWLLSPLGYKSTDATPVYSAFVVGRDAYGCSEINEGVAKNIFHALGHGDDPLEQRSTMGFKTYYGCRVLNDNFMMNFKVTHS